MFSSPYDARALCKKLLQEPALRQELVEASNLFIEKHGRWENNFKNLEELLGFPLTGDGEGSVRLISTYPKLPKGVSPSTKRLKSLWYSLLLFLGNLPGA